MDEILKVEGETTLVKCPKCETDNQFDHEGLYGRPLAAQACGKCLTPLFSLEELCV